MDLVKFKELLDDQYSWPDYYTFKFVVKTENKQELINILKGHKISERISKKGTYTSITSRLYVEASQEVLDVYEQVKTVKGILSI